MPQPHQPLVDDDVLHAVAIDSSRFGELYDLLYDRVYAYVYRRTYDVSASQDIVANTFYHIMTHLSTFRWQGSAQFYAWVFRIAINEITTYYRRGKKYQVVEDWLEIEAADEASLLDDMINEDESRELHRRVAELPPKLREAVELYYFAGLPHEAIAASLRISESAARVRLHRAVEQLRKEYER